MRAGGLRFHRMHAALELQFAGDGRDHRLVAIVADAHLDLVREIDAFDIFQKAVHEMLPRLLAVADNVDAGVFLDFHREQGRVALAVDQVLAFETPRRPQAIRLREPGRFRQASGDGGLEQHDD